MLLMGGLTHVSSCPSAKGIKKRIGASESRKDDPSASESA